LSNFEPVQVELDGVIYPTVEHAYQAAKTFNSEERDFVLSQGTPGRAKRASRKITISPDWDSRKLGVMEDLLFQKFLFHEELGQKLLETGNIKLEEGNTWGDTFWGVDYSTGVGQNNLGKLLMKVRSELRS